MGNYLSKFSNKPFFPIRATITSGYTKNVHVHKNHVFFVSQVYFQTIYMNI